VTPLVEVQGVSKTYEAGGQQVHALEDVSFELRAGEFFAIIGVSGCGKSTLLAILGGLLPASRGRVLVEGEPIVRPRPDKIGFVFQDYSLLAWRTVLENIELGLEVRGMPRAQRRRQAEAQLELVGLTRFARAYPHQLSGGMRQRVAIARSLTLGCKILLLDEPFGALDEQTRLMMGQDLLAIHRETKGCVVLVTHSISEAIHLADRVAVMSARPGRITEIVDVSLPDPRVPAVRASAPFVALQESLWSRLEAQWIQAQETGRLEDPGGAAGLQTFGPG
jgi:NitT/TauT family transport system ATP-binding protein